VQNGTVQMSILPAVTLTVVDPRLQVVGLPWIVPSPEAAAKIIDGPLGQQTAGWLRAKGMEPLAIGSNGFRQLANRKHAVQTPGDLQGLKVRVPGSRLLVDTWKLLGAEPTVVNFAELYTALQQGTVDGEELPFAYKLSTKFYEVEKYATRINYSFDLIYIVVSKRVWDAIPAADQDLLRSTAQLAARDERRFLDTGDSSAVSQLQAHGMSVISLTAPQLKAFQTQARPIYTEFEGGIGKAIIQQWLNASSH
jgi:tripartite ATP-independent transporter DctP family solute receptor